MTNHSLFPPQPLGPKEFFPAQLSNQSLDIFMNCGVINKRDNTRRGRSYQDLKQKELWAREKEFTQR